MKSIIPFFKKNFAWVVVFGLIALFVLRETNVSYAPRKSSRSYEMSQTRFAAPMAGEADSISADSNLEYASTEEKQADRMVVKNTQLSLVAEDVSQVIANIEEKTSELSGFVVNSELFQPEEGASGSIVVRVPTEKRDEALDSFKSLGIRVVSENVQGRDVTDAYQDTQARLEVLEKTKAKLESLLDQSNQVSDILEVQTELTNVQAKIDRLKGQEKYLQESSELTKITIYVSTDELALPYTPQDAWSAKNVFKTAVRSFILTLRSIAGLLIWVVVFAPIWIPLFIVSIVGKKFWEKRG